MSSPSTLVQPVPRRADRRLDTAWLGGVCGGLGEHTPVPSWLWRVAFIATTVGLGCGLVAYVALWILMPRAPVAPVVVADEPAP